MIWRGLRESLITTFAAWLAAVLFFAAVVLAYQRLVYDPAGLQLRFFSPTPCLPPRQPSACPRGASLLGFVP